MLDGKKLLAKELLAKILANENISVIVNPNVREANFNLKTRVLTIPLLKLDTSNNVYNMYVGHEVGHALFTPLNKWLEAIKVHDYSELYKNILNILEDVRIEKLMGNKFGGLSRYLFEGWNEIFQKGMFGLKTKNDIENAIFLDRLNLHAKVGLPAKVPFSKEEKYFVDKSFKTETFDDVLELAEEIIKYFKIKLDEQLQIQIKIQQSSSPDKKNDDKSKPEDEGKNPISSKDMVKEEENDLESKENNESGAESKEEKSGSGSGSGEKEDDSEKSKEDNNGDDGNDDGDEESIKKLISEKTVSFGEINKILKTLEGQHSSITIKNLDKNKEVLIEKNNNTNKINNHIHLVIPKVNIDDVIVPYKKVLENFNENNTPIKYVELFDTENKDIINYMVKEFELRKNARISEKIRENKTGILNEKKLYRYGLSDELFRTNQFTETGKSHGLVLIVDMSGSMNRVINNTFKQVLCITDFCKKQNLPFLVYGFTDGFSLNDRKSDFNNFNGEKYCIPFEEKFCLVEVLSSKMKKLEYRTAKAILLNIKSSNSKYLRLSGTPLNNSIIYSIPIVRKFKKENNVEYAHTIFLTDGASNAFGNITNKLGYPHNYDKITLEFENKFYSFSNDIGYSITEQLFNIFRNSITDNLIGFYLLDNSLPEIKNIFGGSDNINRENFISKGYTLGPTKAGYDKLFLINTSSMNTGNIDIKNAIKEAKTDNEISILYNNAMKKGLSSRIMLNEFIAMITFITKK